MRDLGTGGLEAGELRTYQALRLTATDVHEWSMKGETFSHGPDHAMEGVEPVEVSVGLGSSSMCPPPCDWWPAPSNGSGCPKSPKR